jgi:PIN domain nuclease of toxin-antitoxin system
MRALLDTQGLIWFANGDRRLPTRARDIIASKETELVLSVVTAWEIVIKAGLGKLFLSRPAPEYISYYIQELALIPLQITLQHVLVVHKLPSHHGDPFDRLLIAQAKYEDIPIITGDRALANYDVQTIW